MATRITNLTNFADQVAQLQLPDGSTATMELIFNGATERWTMNVSYGTFTATQIGVCCYPNMLRQWEEILPFGIAFTTADQTDPFDINDFVSGRVSVYLLNADDIATINTVVFGGPQI